jgi:hypothetical protein
MWIAIFLGIIYVIGAMLFYALDGWFKYPISGYGRNEDLIIFSFIWFVMIFPFAAWALKKKIEQVKENKLSKEKEENKVRVAAKREMAQLEEELELEIQRKRPI